MSYQQNKTYNILKGTIPISLARLASQIVYVCAMLTNFQPALVPLPTAAGTSKSDVDDDESDSDSNKIVLFV